ncbi:MAG TPA: hypothetical protein VGP39_19940 [Bradyrhizobium sp.]|nr:hypothetical protein [Bradyrhizobium sp.]
MGRQAAAAEHAVVAFDAIAAVIGKAGIPFIEADREAPDRERFCNGHLVNRVFALDAIRLVGRRSHHERTPRHHHHFDVRY